jgi:hypothetical protein
VRVAGVQSFDRSSDFKAAVPGIGILKAEDPDDQLWAEYGVRVGYKLTEIVTLDGFVNGVSGAGEVDTRVHGGVGLRFQF